MSEGSGTPNHPEEVGAEGVFTQSIKVPLKAPEGPASRCGLRSQEQGTSTWTVRGNAQKGVVRATVCECDPNPLLPSNRAISFFDHTITCVEEVGAQSLALYLKHASDTENSF